MAIYSYAKTYKIEIADFQPNVEIKKNKYMDTTEYINNIEKINNEEEDTFDKDEYEYINSVSLSDNKNNEPIMILLHINNNNYQLIYFNEDLDEDIKYMKK